MNLADGQIRAYNPMEIDGISVNKPYLYGQIFEDEDGNLFFCSTSVNGIIRISPCNEMKVLRWDIDENEVKKLGRVREANERMFSLDWFVNSLQKANIGEPKRKKDGAKIWKWVCNK